MNKQFKRLSAGLFVATVLAMSWLAENSFAETLSTMVWLSSVTAKVPTGIAVGREETLFVIQASANRVAIIEKSGNRRAELSGFKELSSIAVDQTGRLYVGDAGNGSVLVYGDDLVLQGALGSGEGEFGRPIGIAFNASGDVYVADRIRDQIQIYGPDRQLKGRFGQSGSMPGQIRHPLAVAVDKGANEIVVLDLPMVEGTYGLYEGSRAQFFDPSGEYLRGCGQNGIGEGKLAKARGVAADHNGRIYVSDAYQNVVSVFDRTGEYLATIYNAANRLRNPTGVAIDEISGRLFVSSGSADRIDTFGKPVTAESRIDHTVQVETLGPGVVTPAGAVTVQDHQDLLLSCTPDQGHVIADVLIDGISIGARDSYTLADVTADHRVQVLFADPTYIITATAGSGGSISPTGPLTVPHGQDTTFTITPESGYQVAELTVDGNRQGALNSYTFTAVSDAHDLSVTFIQHSHLIEASSTLGGSITPSGAIEVESGAGIDFIMTPEPGYSLSRLLVDDSPVTVASRYSFSQVTAPHTIRAEYSKNLYRIEVSSTGNGSVSPTGPIEAPFDTTQDFTFLPEQGQRVAAVLVDGQSIPAADSYSFSPVRANHTLVVFFAKDGTPPVALAGPDQTVSSGVVTLYGGNSFDPDGLVSSFLWEQIDGVPVALSDPLGANPYFTAPESGSNGASLSFRLTATDDTGGTAQDECLITVLRKNQPPDAQAGPDQTVRSGDIVSLDGADSVDGDGSITAYEWTQIGGEPVTLTGADSAIATFSAPDVSAALTFRLLVTDNGGLKGASECLVNIEADGNPPVADAGPDQIVREGEPVMLSGRDSFAANGIAGYLWTQVAGTPSGQLNNLTTDSVSFMAPRVDKNGTILSYQLMVVDEAGLAAVDQVFVRVYNALAKDAYPHSKRVTGKVFAVTIELPAGISYKSLQRSSLAVTRINGQAIQPVSRTGAITIRDSNRNGIPDLTVTFDRKRIKGLLVPGPATITVSGRLLDGSEFQQSFRMVFSR